MKPRDLPSYLHPTPAPKGRRIPAQGNALRIQAPTSTRSEGTPHITRRPTYAHSTSTLLSFRTHESQPAHTQVFRNSSPPGGSVRQKTIRDSASKSSPPWQRCAQRLTPIPPNPALRSFSVGGFAFRNTSPAPLHFPNPDLSSEAQKAKKDHRFPITGPRSANDGTPQYPHSKSLGIPTAPAAIPFDNTGYSYTFNPFLPQYPVLGIPPLLQDNNTFAKEMSFPRPLTEQERALTRWMIEHGTAGAERFLEQLDKATVVSGCDCGCASASSDK